MKKQLKIRKKTVEGKEWYAFTDAVKLAGKDGSSAGGIKRKMGNDAKFIKAETGNAGTQPLNMTDLTGIERLGEILGKGKEFSCKVVSEAVEMENRELRSVKEEYNQSEAFMAPNSEKNVPELYVPVFKAEFYGHTFSIYGSWEEPLFVAGDVAEVLEYDSTSMNKMTRKISKSEKLLGKIFRAGQNRMVTMFTEKGFYDLMMYSDKPKAQPFREKIKRMIEVVRKEGKYEVPHYKRFFSASGSELSFEQKRELLLHEKETALAKAGYESAKAETIQANAEFLKAKAAEMDKRLEYYAVMERKILEMAYGSSRRNLERISINLLAGEEVVRKFEIPDRKSYSLTEISSILVERRILSSRPSPQFLGRLASAYGLKSKDFAFQAPLEINGVEKESWRYFENSIEKFSKIILSDGRYREKYAEKKQLELFSQ